MSDHKIQSRFSNSARRYDRFSGLHRGIADQLFDSVNKGPAPSALLDVGCGTGYLTVKLKEKYPSCRVIGLDFAQGMLEVAGTKHQEISWVLGDGHDLPFADSGFDTVISNLAYQWAGDLSRAFSEARRVLAHRGVLACTLFGYNTCQELFQSLEEAKKSRLPFKRLPDVAQVREALAVGGFKSSDVGCAQVKVEFKDMRELIVWLKMIGANNLSRGAYLGPATIAKAAAIYQEKFACRQGVRATFEVIQVYAGK